MSDGLSILYLGPISGTCLDRAMALGRLGHQVEHMDLRLLLPKTPWVDRITWRLGGNLLAPLLMRGLENKLNGQSFDLCYVDGGELVTSKVISLVRRYTSKIINYNIDDPLGPRDGARYKEYRKSLANYDLCVVMRDQNVSEAKALGAKNVMRVFMTADEVSHAPRALNKTEDAQWDSDILFLGTWMPERGPFLLYLINLGLPLTIRGSNWHKAPEWPQLKRYWKGGFIGGDNYAKAIQCAKVNLGLLSKGNRDLHTTRSVEIPALGGLLCAERTSEHLSMYAEGQESLFWKDVEECAAMCSFALANEARRMSIAKAGHQRVMKNGHYNEMVLASILANVGFAA
jgi:spore maturation protein CgeB